MAKVQAMKDACSTEARAAKGYTADVKQHMMIAKSKQTAAEEALSKVWYFGYMDCGSDALYMKGSPDGSMPLCIRCT